MTTDIKDTVKVLEEVAERDDKYKFEKPGFINNTMPVMLQIGHLHDRAHRYWMPYKERRCS